MFKTLTGRLITITLALVISGWQLYSKGLTLGLDLRGGMHLQLEVEDPEGTLTDEAKADLIDQAVRIVRSRIDELGVEEPLVQKEGAYRLTVELAGISDQQQAREIVSQSAYLEFKLVLATTDVERALDRIDRAIVAELGEDRLREMGHQAEDPAPEATDLLSRAFGGAAVADSTAADSTVADSASVADSTASQADTPQLRPLSALLMPGDIVLKDQVSVGNFMVDSEDMAAVDSFLALPSVQAAMPRNQQLHWGEQPLQGAGGRIVKRLYVLTENPFMDGSELEDALAQRDPQFNRALVLFELSRTGGRRFGQFTGEHILDNLAIVLDDVVISAPTIQDRIQTNGQIDLGMSPLEEARDLALVLRAGALPAPLEIVSERAVGPSLGEDSIAQGRIAGAIGLVLVVLIMVLYYRMAGVLAVGALAVYVALILGGLAGIGASLTLPGIAGLILSVGMAVDANVLIFERIREELAVGRATRTAVDEGFAHALSAIVDANITTLITALILYQFGTGPVRGFAVTLSIGIVASFFSALFVTRSFFEFYLHGKKASDPIHI